MSPLVVMDGYKTTSEGCYQCKGLSWRHTEVEVSVWVGKYVLLRQTPCVTLAGANKKGC